MILIGELISAQLVDFARIDPLAVPARTHDDLQAGGLGQPPHARGVATGPARRHVHHGVPTGLAVPRQLLRLQFLIVEDAGIGGLTTGSPEIAEGVLVHQGDAERLRVNGSGDRLNGHRSYPSNRQCNCPLRPQEHRRCGRDCRLKLG